MLKRYYTGIILFILLFSITAYAEHKSPVHPRKSTPKRDIFMMEKRLFDLINSERKAKNLPEFKLNTKIQNAARAHSKDMVKRRFFDHLNPDKQDVGSRLKAVNIKWAAVAENIASNKNMDDPIETAFKSWLNSSSHYKNIINPEYELSGIGIAQGQDDTFFFTQIFVKQ